jgi:hypothetical protein
MKPKLVKCCATFLWWTKISCGRRLRDGSGAPRQEQRKAVVVLDFLSSRSRTAFFYFILQNSCVTEIDLIEDPGFSIKKVFVWLGDFSCYLTLTINI